MIMPKVSVIVPVYNKVNYVENCINSILKWGQCEYEVIIIDDGSTDGSSNVLDHFTDVPSVTILHQSNCGVSAARNVGLKISKGEYITFVDADDELIEGTLDKIFPFLTGMDDICIAGAIDEGEKRDPIFSDMVFEGLEAKTVLDFVLTGGSTGQTIPKLATKFMSGCKEKFYRRAFIDNSGLQFDESLIRNEDVLWSCYCYYFAKRIHFLPVNVYINKIDPNGIMRGTDLQKTINSFVSFLHKFDVFFRDNLTEQILGNFYFHQSAIVNYEAFRALKLRNISIRQFHLTMNKWYASNPCIFMLKHFKGTELSFFKKIAYFLMKIHCYVLVGIEMDIHHRIR